MPNRIFGLSIAALSLLLLVFGIPTIGSDEGFLSVGPKLFPTVAACLTLLFGILMAMQRDGETQVSELQSSEARASLLWVVGIGLIFIVLLTLLGFLISAFLSLAAFLLAFGERRIKLVLLVSLGVPVVVYLIFLNVFALELPAGPLDFLLGGL